jgi:hypothetical protein
MPITSGSVEIKTHDIGTFYSATNQHRHSEPFASAHPERSGAKSKNAEDKLREESF